MKMLTKIKMIFFVLYPRRSMLIRGRRLVKKMLKRPAVQLCTPLANSLPQLKDSKDQSQIHPKGSLATTEPKTSATK